MPRRGSRFAIWVTAAGLVACAGCAVVRRPAVPVPPRTAQELLDTVDARRAATSSLRARSRVKAGLAGVWTRQAVLVRRPAQLRIDVLSPFGLALAIGSTPARLWVFPPAEGTRFEGAPRPEVVARVLGIPVAIEDLVDILLGVPPRRDPAGRPSSTVTAAGEVEIVLPVADGYQSFWFAGDDGELRRVEERRADGAVLRVVFDDYRDGFPWSVEVEIPALGQGVRLAYDVVERNVELDALVFEPPPAPRVLPLERATAGG